MKKYKFIAIIGIIVLSSFSWRGTFPKFSLVSYHGEVITQENVKNKKTIVALFHLGCAPAMILMNDLDSLNKSLDTSEYQIIAFLENTQNHIEQFYSDSSKTWTPLRKHYKVKEVSYPLIPECKTENIEIRDGQTILGQHCRVISKKVHTKSSPTVLLIDGNGRIIKKEKGYIANADISARMGWLREFSK